MGDTKGANDIQLFVKMTFLGPQGHPKCTIDQFEKDWVWRHIQVNQIEWTLAALAAVAHIAQSLL